MNLKQIKELVDLLDNSSLTEIDINDKEFKLTLKKEIKQEVIYNQEPTRVAEPSPVTNQADVQSAPEAEVDNSITINAPMVGTFYKSP